MKQSPLNTIGKRIAQARRELAVREGRDVLQSDLAEELGVGGATISRWEADQAIPRDAVLVDLAAFLGVTPAYLRYGVTETAEPRKSVKVAAQPSMTITGREKKRRPGEA